MNLVGRATRTFAINVLGAGLAFLLHFAFARYLGAAEYGIYVYVITWVTVLGLISVLGYDGASLKFLAEYQGRGETAATHRFMALATRRALKVAVAVALPLALVALLIQASANHSISLAVLVGGLLLPCAVLLHLHGYFLQGLGHAEEAQYLQLVLRPVVLIAGCAGVAWYAGPVNAIEALVVTLVVTAFIALLAASRVRRFAPVPGSPAASEVPHTPWKSTASALLLVTLAQQVLVNGDVIAVGLLLGTTEAGVYAVAAKLAMLVSFATSSINLILAPAISDLHARGRQDELQDAVTVAGAGALLYAIPVLCALLVGGHWILHQFGAEFADGYWVLAILCMGQAAIVYNGSVGFLMTMTGNHELAWRIIGFSAALMILLAVVGGVLWGMEGVAVATAFALAIRSVLLARQVRGRLGIEPTPLRQGSFRHTALRMKNLLKRHYPDSYAAVREAIDPALREVRFMVRVGIGVVWQQRMRPRPWRRVLPLQARSRLDLPEPSVRDLNSLRSVLRGSEGVRRIAEGAHTLYLAPSLLKQSVLHPIARRYPPDTGLKLLKRPLNAGAGDYLHGTHGRLQRAVTYGPDLLVMNANVLHLHGLGPRLYDLLELHLGHTRWLAYAVRHCAGQTPSIEQCRSGIERIRSLQQSGLLRVTANGGIDDPDFACPHCNGNALSDAGTGAFRYVDFQNFVLEHFEKYLEQLAGDGAAASHFGSVPLIRGKRYLYQSVPGSRLPAKRDTAKRGQVFEDLLRQANVSLSGRLVLEFGCNIGMMMGQYLRLGAAWCHGWDMPEIVPHAERLLLATGCTRFSLTPRLLQHDMDPSLDLGAHLVPQMDGCVISYLAMTKHIGWLDALARLPWHAMIVEGHEGDSAEAFGAGLQELGDRVALRQAALTRYSDGDCGPRYLAVLVRRPADAS